MKRFSRTHRNRVSRMSLKEAYIRGYRAAKRRLNEATGKGIWEVVADDLEHYFKNYRNNLEEMVNDMMDDGFLSGGAASAQFYKEVQDWYDSLGGPDGRWGLEDDLLSQVEGAIDEWIKKHQKQILQADKEFDKLTLQDLFGSLFEQYIIEIGLKTGDREILDAVHRGYLLDDDDDF